MTEHEDVPYWLRQLRSCIAMNVHELELWDLAMKAGPPPFRERPVLEAAQAVAKMLTVGEGGHPMLRYRFHPPQRVCTLSESRTRGWGACADGTAAIAAAVVIADGSCVICYEKTPALPSYAHVRVLVEGTPVDAYPEASFDVARCDGSETVSRESVRWSPAVASEMRSRLAALRTRGGT